MPKAAANTDSSHRMHIGRFCAGSLALISLSVIAAPAAQPDLALRPSEQLDTRRIGRISRDEGSVLRVEWHAGQSRAEEAGTMQEMLDSLRRMEETVAEISRLIDSIPAPQSAAAQKPVAAPAADEPPDSDSRDLRWLLANIAAGILVALWWFRGRKTVRSSKPSPDVDSQISELSTIEPHVENIPAVVQTVAMPAIAPSNPAPTPAPAPLARAAKSGGDAHQIKPVAASKAIEDVPAATLPKIEPGTPPPREKAKPPPPPPEAPPIDFLLEEADPDTVARENAKARQQPRNASAGAPEDLPETNLEPTLQLAEIMLSMGLEQGAAQALLEYIEANPRKAVYHWLKLLGIYRKQGQHAEFVETAEKLRKHFNVQAEDWVRADTGEVPTLEKFPRVADHVLKTWTQPVECLAYLQQLLEDNRDGARAGFPQAVAEDILLLIEILKELSGTGQAVGV